MTPRSSGLAARRCGSSTRLAAAEMAVSPTTPGGPARCPSRRLDAAEMAAPGGIAQATVTSERPPCRGRARPRLSGPDGQPRRGGQRFREEAGPVRTGLVRGGLVRGGPVRGELVRGGLVRGGLVRCGLVRTGLVRTGLVRGGLVRGGLVRGGPSSRRPRAGASSRCRVRGDRRAARAPIRCGAATTTVA